MGQCPPQGRNTAGICQGPRYGDTTPAEADMEGTRFPTTSVSAMLQDLGHPEEALSNSRNCERSISVGGLSLAQCLD